MSVSVARECGERESTARKAALLGLMMVPQSPPAAARAGILSAPSPNITATDSSQIPLLYTGGLSNITLLCLVSCLLSIDILFFSIRWSVPDFTIYTPPGVPRQATTLLSRALASRVLLSQKSWQNQ